MKKMTKLAALLFASFSGVVFAGSYTTPGTLEDYIPDPKTPNDTFFYVDLGTNYYHFDFADTTLPISIGAGSLATGFSSTPADDTDTAEWTYQPNIALGMHFYNSNDALAKFFGNENDIEFQYSYAHISGDESVDYDYQPGTVFLIDGDPLQSPLTGNIFFTNTYTDYEQTLQTFTLLYRGNKEYRYFTNSPYTGVTLVKLDQDDDYSLTYKFASTSGATSMYGNGSDDLTSYYYGLILGDRMTIPVAHYFAAYADASVTPMGLHTSLDSSEIALTQSALGVAYLNQERTVETTDNKLTFTAKGEVGLNMYLKGNDNPRSVRLTILGGVQYWHDVPYANNPNATGESVEIDYNDSTTYYTGLQLYIPFA
ncbi:MAG: hypothetical protein ACE365_08080 [Gammaproteobacteria bacterium]